MIVEMRTAQPPYHYLKDFQFKTAVYNNTLSYDVEELLKDSASTNLKLFVSNLLQKNYNERLRTASEASGIFQALFIM